MDPAMREYESLPRFSDGRINYTHSKTAPIVACIVEYGEKILIAKRSEEVSHLKNTWNLITGYIDNPNKSAIDHTVLELEEELGIDQREILNMKLGKPFSYQDPCGKKLVVFPVLITMKSKPNIKLNSENVDFAWIEPQNIEEYKVPELAILVRDRVKNA